MFCFLLVFCFLFLFLSNITSMWRHKIKYLDFWFWKTKELICAEIKRELLFVFPNFRIALGTPPSAMRKLGKTNKSHASCVCVVGSWGRENQKRLERYRNVDMERRHAAVQNGIDWLMIAYITLFPALLSRLTALACGSTWVTGFL